VTVGYTIDDIGVLPGGDNSRSSAVNNVFGRDQVAGTSVHLDPNYPESSNSNAVLWDRAWANQAGPLVDIEGALGFQSAVSDAYGMNNTSPCAVVGIHFGDSGATPTLWEGNTRTLLPTLGGGVGVALAVNDAKTIVGSSGSPGGMPNATQWTQQGQQWQAVALQTLGGPWSQAWAINRQGTAVGFAEVGPDVGHACRWVPAKAVQDLHVGPGTSEANGVNDNEVVVGRLDTDAFRWDPGGGMQTLPGLPASTNSHAKAVNNQDMIVGQSWLGPDSHAVLWPGGPAVDLTPQVLNNPGWTLHCATSINDRGQIAGYGQSPSGKVHGFLLTPVRVVQQVWSCPPPKPHIVPTTVEVLGSVQSDGGGIIIDPQGHVIHYQPPRPDPLPMVNNPAAFAAVAGLVLAGLRHQPDPELGAQLSGLASTLIEREQQRMTHGRARNRAHRWWRWWSR
jgi:hypothetical protein